MTVSVITAVLMVAIGLFWMFIWLIGTNGYSETKGTRILASNLGLVLLSIVGSTAASGWLANKMGGATGWSPWVVGPLAILCVAVTSVVVLMIGSLLVVAVFGRTR